MAQFETRDKQLLDMRGNQMHPNLHWEALIQFSFDFDLKENIHPPAPTQKKLLRTTKQLFGGGGGGRLNIGLLNVLFSDDVIELLRVGNRVLTNAQVV